jgi:hypothetical protein
MIDIEGPLSKFSVSLTGEVHIGERALLDIKIDLVWLYRSPISVWGGGEGVFYLFT